MTPAFLLERVVQLVLFVLAGYHIIVGGIALAAPSYAPLLMRSLYGARIPQDDGAVRYMTSMIGALALAIGMLAAVAALRPSGHTAIVAALLVLQFARMFCRIRDRQLLATALGVPARSNAAAIVLLGLECAVFGLWLARTH